MSWYITLAINPIHKGETTVLTAVTGDYCTAGNESILDTEESRRTMDVMLECHKQVNAAIVDPHFVVNVRKKLLSLIHI